MYPSIDADDRIAQARRAIEPASVLLWNSFGEFFRNRVYDRTLVDRPYLSYHDDSARLHRTYAYAEFGAIVERAANFLHEGLGLTRGDRLATVLFNHDVTVVLYFAAWTLGVSVVPINVEEPPEKKRYILEHSEAAAVVCREEGLDELAGFRDELPQLRHMVAMADPGGGSPLSPARAIQARACRTPRRPSSPGTLRDQALIVYTSGTTGPPKGVVLTAENLLLDADAIAAWHHFGSEDRLMGVLPIHHVNGIVVTLLTPFYCKGGAVLNRTFKPAVFWRRLEQERVSCTSVVPTLLEFLLDADEDLSSYRLDRFGGVICGAGPLLKDTAARFEDRFGMPIRHGYGLSETTCYSSFLPADLSVHRRRQWLTAYEVPSIGLPIRHTAMAVLDGSGRPVPEGAKGEICIRGGTVCAGYLKRPEANAAAFQWGWFRSGDEGSFTCDEQGRPFFFISGRLKELIIRGGINISPLEIDAVLTEHPDVKCGMAVPFVNRYYGEEIAAYVVPRSRASCPTETELLDFCRRRLPFWKQPKVILFGDDLPYTPTGKPKRLELKGQLASRLADYQDRQFKE